MFTSLVTHIPYMYMVIIIDVIRATPQNSRATIGYLWTCLLHIWFKQEPDVIRKQWPSCYVHSLAVVSMIIMESYVEHFTNCRLVATIDSTIDKTANNRCSPPTVLLFIFPNSWKLMQIARCTLEHNDLHCANILYIEHCY